MARTDPKKDIEYHRKYRQTAKYKKWHNAWAKEWRRKNPERLKTIHKRYLEKNKDKVRERHNRFAREYTKRLRLELVEKFGGKCVCCQESNPNFLTIDHVNSDGVSHRKLFRSSRELYRDLARKGGTERYKIQILCFNCNMGRQFHGGKQKICPHKIKNDFC